MSSLLDVVLVSLAGGLISLVGGFLLLSNKKRAHTLAEYAAPFAAGALLAAAFADLLREASHHGSIEDALLAALFGILGFFLLERSLRWLHHHQEYEDGHATDPNTSLIIIGDVMHNFIDGIAIASGFLISPQSGIVVTLAVAAHEIPQEIGDFGLLLRKGMGHRKIIWVNVSSAIVTAFSAAIFFQLGQSVKLPIDIMLGLVAGFFIYVAISDIIPSIHNGTDKQLATRQSALLIAGALLVSVLTIQLHTYIEHDTSSKQEVRPELLDKDHAHEEPHNH